MQGVPATNHQPSISPRVTVQNPLSHQGVRPPLTLVLGPAGAGKTAWALQRFIACHEAGERPLLIVSSPQQAQTRAEQLAEHLDCQPATILPSLRTFRQLATDIAPQEPDTETDSETDGKSDSNENTRLIGRSFQRLALADIFRNTIRPDDFLGRMRHAPGFVPALSERLREWKLACLDPDTLEQSGPILAAPLADPTFARKTGDLARLYRAYESFLKQNRLRDDEDCLRDAVARARSGKGLQTLLKNTTCILVDGFYRFNPMQRLLLAALAEQQLKVVVTLPYEERRPLLFAAPARTLSLLQKEFTCHLLTLPDRTKREISPLGMLSGGVFLGIGGSREYWGYSRVFEGIEGIEGIGENQSMPSNAPNTQEHPIPTNTQKHLRIPNTSPPLLLFDAPNPYVEAEMVAREFRRLYDAGGYAWGDFGVILRAMGDYAPILAAVFERHGIPLGVDGPETLTENPMLKTLLHLLAVVRRNWQRDDVLAFLKSSYTAPDRLEADALRRRARRAGVREGREQWLSLMGEMREEGRGKREEEEEEKWKEIPGGEEGEGEEWHGEWEEVGNEEIIEEWGGEIEPDSNDNMVPVRVFVESTLGDMAHYETLLRRDRQDPRHFAALIEEIVSYFGLEERIAQGETTRQQRDRVAWDSAKEVLRALAQMASLAGRGQMTFDAFHDELIDAWQNTSSIAIAPGDRVRVAEPYDARERPLKVAAVMGLTERVFPRRITEDPFLRDEERVALREWAGLDLEEQKGRSDDERFFFYLAITAPSERLILSYPRSTDEADTLPSFYLDEVRAVFTPPPGVPVPEPSPLCIVSRTLADVAPRPEEVTSDSDRLLAACAGLFDPNPAAGNAGLREALSLMQGCLQTPQTRQIAQQVVASRNLPRLPRLKTEASLHHFTANRTVFSVSELESYGRCPFQYLLQHTLHLHSEEEGAHTRAQGTLLHAVLHHYFASRASSAGNPPLPPCSDPTEMRTELQSILGEMLAKERLDASPHQLRMMHRLLADAIDNFVAREQHFTELFGMRPAYFELAFGHGQRPEWEEDEGERGGTEGQQGTPTKIARIDPASCAEPLYLNVTDGGAPVAICGTLDRVDLDITGRKALVLDYKLGKPPTFSDIQTGRSLQMPLYLLATERLFGKVGAVACYDSMRERGRRRFHRSEHVNARQFMPVIPLEDGTSVTPLNRNQFLEILNTAEAAAIRLARTIVSGNIEATPGDHCRTCAYSDVCRTTLLGGHDGEMW